MSLNDAARMATSTIKLYDVTINKSFMSPISPKAKFALGPTGVFHKLERSVVEVELLEQQFSGIKSSRGYISYVLHEQ